ncbi:MAG: hypothetical protein GXN93_04705 [Candidatus Diapherotrites archaeon]|nr:hypothetical protein [Candidatus Diapherotrites archaeon]
MCTVARPAVETFLDWLDQRGVQVICCGDQGQPPPIAGEWLREKANYYEEITVDHRSRREHLKALKKAIRRKTLPACQGWNEFVTAWHTRALIVVSR